MLPLEQFILNAFEKAPLEDKARGHREGDRSEGGRTVKAHGQQRQRFKAEGTNLKLQTLFVRAQVQVNQSCEWVLLNFFTGSIPLWANI